MTQPEPQTLEFWQGRLPHWEVADHLHFVTIHQAGAIPAAAARQIRAMSARSKNALRGNRVESSWRILQAMERWLDGSATSGQLYNPAVASMVMDAIDHRVVNGVWRVHEYVLMPNHVHFLLDLLSQGLRQSFRNFKRWTACRAHEILEVGPHPLWQTEWFDHWLRTAEETEAIRDYVRQNPVKAGLVDVYTEWPYGSWSRWH